MFDSFQARYPFSRCTYVCDSFDLCLGHIVLATSKIIFDPLAEDGIWKVGLVDFQIPVPIRQCGHGEQAHTHQQAQQQAYPMLCSHVDPLLRFFYGLYI